MLTALTSYAFFQRTAASAAQGAGPVADPAAEAEIAYWRDNINEVRSLLDFVDDDRLVAFAAKAFGFGDTPPNKGLLSLALEQGAAAATSYANRAPDGRMEALVRSFAFAEFGTARLRDPGFIEGVAARYRAQSAAGAESGVRETPREAYFKDRIGSVTSAADLVADLGLYDFALEAFGLEDRRGDRFVIQTALAEGVSDADDLANRLGDPKISAMAAFFGFGEVGTANVRAAEFGDTIIDRHRLATGRAEITLPEGETAASRYFRETISTIGSAEALIGDPRLYSYIMTAFDLGGEIGKRAIAAKVLEEGVSADGTLGNRLGDPRWAQMARTLGIAEFGARNLQDPGVIDEIVSRFERVRAETEIGLQSPAAELAAYFDRKTGDDTRWIDIVADSRLRRVAMTALGMPPAMAAFGSAKLVAEFEARFDITDLSSEAGKERFLQRYLVQAETGGGFRTDPILTLFQNGGGGAAENLYALVARL